jgi:hypothetical protein
MLFRSGVMLAAGAAALSLGACASDGASGGGGGTPTPPPPPGFTSWSDVHPPATVTVQGIAQEVTFTAGGGGPSISPPSGVLNGTYVETIDAGGAASSISIADGNRTVAFSKSNGDSVLDINKAGQNLLTGLNKSQTDFLVTPEPSSQGWNYQTYGVWETGGGTASGSAGAFSVGVQTAGSAIPTTGNASFTGIVTGIYIDSTGTDHLLGAPLTVNVDFVQRSAAFNSQNMTDQLDGSAFAGAALSGTLTYAAGQNSLTGTLTTSSGRLSGTATARFYGPSANELGGIFALTPVSGGGLERFGGGFGVRH